MNLNLVHLHLLLNHFPTVGTVIALSLFGCALIGRNEDLKRASLAVFFVIALVSLPAYMSGNAALDAITGRPDITEASLIAHQDAALLALIFMEITGLVAWFGLWQVRRVKGPTRGNLAAVLILAIITVALMARTATLGGEIRHEEIRFAQDGVVPPPQAANAWISVAAVSSFVADNTWVWPASETIHFVGLCLLFGIVLLVNLRMLGMMKRVPFSALHRLLPWAILGFAINTVTGMLFFIGAPGQYTENVAFYWKVALILIAGVNALYLTLFDEAYQVGAGDDPPMTAKLVAASAIVLWVGVIYTGRMLPFIGNAF
jgi:uncharacterized membrane protein